MGNIVFSSRQILIDGKSEQIRSGAMHYFRIMAQQWSMRLEALKSCGLNTVETYMPWNLHEKHENHFDFQGNLDIAGFLRIAAEKGIYVILRPGPYICSEWDLGGLPPWLLTKGCRLRSSDPDFMFYAARYLREVFKEVRPFLYTNGGTVIAMQLENEYIGDDLKYMEELRDLFLNEGINVPLMCSNAPGDLSCSLPDNVAASVNGRNHPAAMCEALKKIRPDDPPFVMELWNGAGQYWGDDFIEHAPEEVASDIREAMEQKINFNLYMFHGGTSFGFMSGSGGGFGGIPAQELLSSYDVDATLPEGGMPGKKFDAVRREILKALPDLQLPPPPLPRHRAYGEVKLTEAVPLFDALENLSSAIPAETPLSFEELHCYYGFVLYRFRAGKSGMQSVTVENMRDRVQFFVNGRYSGTLHRNDAPGKKFFFKASEGEFLDFLVENCGRLRNTISELQHDCKGLGRVINGNNCELLNCLCYPLPLEDLSALPFRSSENFTTNEPAFYRGYMEVDETADTFLRIPTGTRGVVWINGFNLGRYRSTGPQYTLYVPEALLKKGRNEVIVFELEHLGMNMAWSQSTPDLGRKRQMLL